MKMRKRAVIPNQSKWHLQTLSIIIYTIPEFVIWYLLYFLEWKHFTIHNKRIWCHFTKQRIARFLLLDKFHLKMGLYKRGFKDRTFCLLNINLKTCPLPSIHWFEYNIDIYYLFDTLPSIYLHYIHLPII